MTQSITGILLGSLLWFTSDWLALHHFQSPNAGGVLRVLCIYFFVGNFFTTFSSLFSAFQDVLANKLVEFVRSWGIVAFTIYFWTTHGTVVNFATAWILGTITALFVIAAYFFGKYWAILRLGRIEITRNLLSEYFGYSFWILIGANAGVILGQIDQQMIVNLLSPEAAGYYANFLSLSTIFNVFLGPLLGFLFPLYSELIHRDSKESIHHLNRILFTYFPAFSFIVSGFLFALAAPLTLFLFGEKYALSAELLQHMAPFIVFNILIQITFSALAGF
jgi:O-antigen/teichoic acid export membrane protein